MESKLSRRIKRLDISLDLLAGMFHDGNVIHCRVTDGLPEDARVVNVRSDVHLWPGRITLVIESETFPEIDPIEEIPSINPVFHTIV